MYLGVGLRLKLTRLGESSSNMSCSSWGEAEAGRWGEASRLCRVCLNWSRELYSTSFSSVSRAAPPPLLLLQLETEVLKVFTITDKLREDWFPALPAVPGVVVVVDHGARRGGRHQPRPRRAPAQLPATRGAEGRAAGAALHLDCCNTARVFTVSRVFRVSRVFTVSRVLRVTRDDTYSRPASPSPDTSSGGSAGTCCGRSC